jgi:DNA-directed RNA polymerase specialized sigma subunit
MSLMSLQPSAIDESTVRMMWPASYSAQESDPGNDETGDSSDSKATMHRNKEILEHLVKGLSRSERKHLASLRDGVTQTAFARSQNVTRSAICQRESKLIKKLRKLAQTYTT